ncbi:hypothetical protein [Candidatus Hodarchaeum mangrovi]
MSAAINTLKETQGQTITAIRHVGFTLLLYEGLLTYGILTTSEAEYDPIQFEFLREVILKFELMFSFELSSGTLFTRSDFEVFHQIVDEMYDKMVGIDVDGLRKILKVMNYSKIRNFIVYENHHFQPVFTSIVDPLVNIPLHKITKIFREMNYLCEPVDGASCEIDFDDIWISGVRIPTHWLILLSPVQRLNRASLYTELNAIRDTLLRKENNSYISNN